MRRALLVLLLALPANAGGPVVDGAVLDGVVLAPVIASTNCTGATDWTSGSSRHLYFMADTSWAGGGIPDDECVGGCTTRTLETSTGLTEAGDLSSADLPSGTLGTYTAVDLVVGEDATSATNLWGADGTDYSMCAWLKTTNELDDDLISLIGNGGNETFFYTLQSGANEKIGFFIGESAAESTDGFPPATWTHVCWILDDSAGGNDTTIAYSNGVSKLNVTTAEDARDAVTTCAGLRCEDGNDVNFKAHEVLIIQGTVLTQTQACQIALCGATGTSATEATRVSTYGDCSP